jgi:hypothetical protein
MTLFFLNDYHLIRNLLSRSLILRIIIKKINYGVVLTNFIHIKVNY